MSGCPSDSDLDRFHAGEMEEEESARIRGHLASCVACARRDEALLGEHDDLLQHVRHLGPLENPEDVRKTVGGSGADGAEADGDPAPRFVGQVDDRVGPYKLLEVLGEGGFGVVYVAEQSKPVRRRVALKILKPGMDTKEVIARFEAERQALAMMDHPNVARVYDAGATERGRPYFVMEHVPGVSITDYCDRHTLDTEQRLGLFIQVCDALQHAHQKGIIHRDIKPGNVLVTVQDGRAVPKVIDFGLAKAISHRLTERTIYTEQGQLIGTPEYMSPEQAEMTGLNVDTRTDIYSLGVLLYELLVGTLPFDSKYLREAGFAEIQRIIREDEPPKPSLRLSRLGMASSSIAQRRHTDLPSLAGQLRGDLDWITMKCLEKDRTRRYGSASELAADISRYLSHEPVLASPPSTAYRLNKFIRRNRTLVLGSAAVLAALILGIIGTSLGLARATRERNRAKNAERIALDLAAEADSARQVAEAEAAKATAVRRFLEEDMLSSVAEGGVSGPEVKVREVLDKASEAIAARFHDQPEIEVSTRTTIGAMYVELGLLQKAEALLRPAVELGRRALGESHTETLDAKKYLSWSVAIKADGEAIRLGEEVLNTRKRLQGPEHLDTLDAMDYLADAYVCMARWNDAERVLREALRLRRRVQGERDYDTYSTMSSLGLSLVAAGKLKEAGPLLRQAAAGFSALRGPDHPYALRAIQLLSRVLRNQGNLAEAESLLRRLIKVQGRVLGEEHFERAVSMLDLSNVFIDQARFDEAEALCREALPHIQKSIGEECQAAVLLKYNMARCLLEQGERDEAKTRFLGLLDVTARGNPELERARILVLSMVGRLYTREERYAEAEDLLTEAVQLVEKNYPAGNYATGPVWITYGELLTRLERFEEAERHILAGLDNLQSELAADDSRIVRAHTVLVALYDEWGRPEKAAQWRAKLPASSGGLPGGRNGTIERPGVAPRATSQAAPEDTDGHGWPD